MRNTQKELEKIFSKIQDKDILDGVKMLASVTGSSRKETNEIYAIDFDGVLHLGTYPQIGEPNLGVIDKIKELQTQGKKIILWTCRTGKTLTEAVDWCGEYGLVFDAVNADVDGTECKKVYADCYVDDRNMAIYDFVSWE